MSISANNHELEYIRSCLRVELLSNHPLPDPDPGLDWERLFVTLQQNKLTAYFYSIVKRIPDRLPASFWKELRQEHYRYLIYGDQCAKQVRKVLVALHEGGINVIVLKGWAFIQTLYGGDPSQRFCQDIDILVHPEDAQAAEGVLQKAGFQGTEEYWPGYKRRYMNARAFISSKQTGSFGDMFSIGLHWGLLQIPAYSANLIDSHSLFQYARPLRVEGVEVFELAAEDEVVYACAHYWLHHRTDSVLLRFFETAALIMKADRTFDWDVVLKHAKAWQVILPLRNVLAIIESLWPNVIPPLVQKQLLKGKPTTSEYFVDRWIALTKSNLTYIHLLKWLTLPGFRQRLCLVYENVFPGPDYMRRNFGMSPSDILPWLYFKRFIRVFHSLLNKVPIRMSLHV